MARYFLRRQCMAWPSYSERLTRIGCNVLCLVFALEPNLHTSTEAQDALRIMDDRPLPRRLLTGCQDGLEETRFGGFFVAFTKVNIKMMMRYSYFPLITLLRRLPSLRWRYSARPFDASKIRSGKLLKARRAVWGLRIVSGVVKNFASKGIKHPGIISEQVAHRLSHLSSNLLM